MTRIERPRPGTIVVSLLCLIGAMIGAMCAGHRSDIASEAPPSVQPSPIPAVAAPPAVEAEPAVFTTEAYPLLKIPVGSSESSYRPAFLMEHYVYEGSGRIVTAIQFVWHDRLAGTDPMGLLKSEDVKVELIAQCDQPTVVLRVMDVESCRGEFWREDLRRTCVEGATIVCCPDELPELSKAVRRKSGNWPF